MLLLLHGGLRSLALEKHQAPDPPGSESASRSASVTDSLLAAAGVTVRPRVVLDSWTPSVKSRWLVPAVGGDGKLGVRQLRFPLPMSRFLSYKDETPFAARDALHMLVDGHNPAHVLSVRWFLRQVYPVLQRMCPSARLVIAGELPQDDITGRKLRWVFARVFLFLCCLSCSSCSRCFPPRSWVDGTPFEDTNSKESDHIHELGMVEDLDDLLSHSRVIVSPLLVPSFFPATLVAYQHALPLVITSSAATVSVVHLLSLFVLCADYSPLTPLAVAVAGAAAAAVAAVGAELADPQRQRVWDAGLGSRRSGGLCYCGVEGCC